MTNIGKNRKQRDVNANSGQVYIAAVTSSSSSRYATRAEVNQLVAKIIQNDTHGTSSPRRKDIGTKIRTFR